MSAQEGQDVAQAAEWFALRRSGQMTLQEGLELEVWLESAPAHLAAFRAVADTWALTHAVATDPEVLNFRESARAIRGRPFFAASMLAAVGLLGLALYAGGVVGLWQDWFAPVSDQQFQTAVGETRSVILADGSSAMLDSDTTLLVHETWRRRAVTLSRGQAYFHVAKDAARPFTVSAAGNVVTATGTAFDVRIDRNRFLVLLIEGRLHVQIPENSSEPAEETDLMAGQRLTAWANGERSVTNLSAEGQAGTLSWRTGHLTFIQAPLSAVAEELNRYSRKKIEVSAELANTPVDGVFRTGDIDGFVKLLLKGRMARVEKATDTTITLTRLKKP
jgi:transmembrane sensor